MINFMAFLNSPLRKMSNVYRYSGLPVIHRESLAEHSFWVAYVAWYLALDWQQHYKGSDTKYAVQWSLLFTGALAHDNEETVTGDFPRPFKYVTPELRKAIEVAAVAAFEKLAEDFGKQLSPLGTATDKSLLFTSALKHAWSNAKNLDTIEGVIVALADAFSVLFYALEEVRLGNQMMAYELDALMEFLHALPNSVTDLTIKPWLEHNVGSLISIYMKIYQWEVL